MKFKWNKKYGKIAAYAIGVIVISGILLIAVNYLPGFEEVFSFMGSVFTPIIWGVVIAYLLNPIMDFFEHRVFKKWQKDASRQKQRRIRAVSLWITVILALAVIAGMVWLVVPQLLGSVSNLVPQLKTYALSIQKWAESTFADSLEIAEFIADPMVQLENYITDLWTSVQPALTSALSKVGGGVISFIMGFKDFIIGFIIAVYLLLAKDMLLRQARKILFAFLHNDFVQHILNLCHRSNKIFRHYMVGILLDAFFVGCLTFIFATIISAPYPLLLAVMISCTNIIPFFGPFIGGIPTAIIVLLDDPLKCLWYVIFMLCMQQFDGNVMVPLIQGDKTGVPSVWVLIAIIIGGGLFGFVGMLLSVPVFAVIYMLMSEWVSARLRKKNLPSDTLLYEENVGRFTNDYVYTDEDRQKDGELLEKIAAEGQKKKKVRIRKLEEAIEKKQEELANLGNDSENDVK